MTERSTLYSGSLGIGDSNTKWVSDGEELARKIDYQFSSHDTVAFTVQHENLLSRSLRTVNFKVSVIKRPAVLPSAIYPVIYLSANTVLIS
jgi:hypothetical protein